MTPTDKSDKLYLGPTNCWDCAITDCKLPFSKILANRKLSEYTYKKHPKCEHYKSSNKK